MLLVAQYNFVNLDHLFTCYPNKLTKNKAISISTVTNIHMYVKPELTPSQKRNFHTEVNWQIYCIYSLNKDISFVNFNS